MMRSLLGLCLILCTVRIAAGCRCSIVEENERYCYADFGNASFIVCTDNSSLRLQS